MNDWLNKPWVIRLISLLLAVLIFIVISFDNQKNQADDVGFDALDNFFSSTQETKTLEDVPVNINIGDNYVVSGVPNNVSVAFEGSVSVVTATVTQRNFEVFVDLEGLSEGTHTVELQHEGISDQINVYIEPKEVEVTIEEKATEEFDITVDYINSDQMEAGFEIQNSVANPSKITIESAKSIVDRIAIVKAFVDVKGANGSFDAEDVPVKVYDSQGNELSVRVEPATVNVSVEIISPNKEVPVVVETTGELPEGFVINSITPQTETVTVFAPEEVLEELESISTEPVDLSVVTEGTTLEVGLVIPSAAVKVEPQEVSVELDIEELQEQTFNNILIEEQNLADGYTITFIEPSVNRMRVTATGKASQLNNLADSDISLSIDLQGLGVGEHIIPITVEGPDGVEISSEFEEVTVEIENS